MPDPRNTTVDDLNPFDIGYRVTFKRPASAQSGRSVIVGQLLGVRHAQYMRGNMPKQGYILTVEYASAPWPYGSKNRDEHGPLPANYPIEVGAVWRERSQPDLSETWEDEVG